jgi:hypothetical protein
MHSRRDYPIQHDLSNIIDALHPASCHKDQHVQVGCILSYLPATDNTSSSSTPASFLLLLPKQTQNGRADLKTGHLPAPLREALYPGLSQGPSPSTLRRRRRRFLFFAVYSLDILNSLLQRKPSFAPTARRRSWSCVSRCVVTCISR